MWNDVETNTGKRNSVDGPLPLSRLLAQTYSYSSDSTTSPLGTTSSRFSPPQLPSSRGGAFSYSESSPVSSNSAGSGQSFSYSSGSGSAFPTRNFKLSSLSDPGSPTLDDAIVMGTLPDSPFGHVDNGVSSTTGGVSTLSPKPKDFCLSELMSFLSVSNNAAPSHTNPGLVNGVNGGCRTKTPINNPPSMGNSLLPQLSPTTTSNQLLNNGMGLGGNFSLGPTPRGSAHCGFDHGLNSNHGLSQSQNLSQGMDFSNLAQFQNMLLNSQLLPNLVDSSNLFGGMGGDFRSPPSQSSLSPHLSSPLSSFFPGADPYAIEKAAKMHRSAAALCDATCTWTGPLPMRLTKNPFYSCKVFLGGVPWDVTELALRQAFLQFGSIQVEWPGKECSANPPRGYVYILFENEKQVKSLLAACTQDFSSENYYFKISSRRMRQKEVQVIPWLISDSSYVLCPSYQLDPAKTVFVGALHGMLSAEGLARVMNDLFGGVVYSGIDTDKHKYPIGSGRVTFNNEQSYRKAVKAAFIEIKTTKFTKKVQVDPYLADSPCQLCESMQGPYFCRDERCFKYYCRSCWAVMHCGDVSTHKPLMRDPKLRVQSMARLI